ncbi:hypothetical protein K1719_012027 [Acacia pycnantha]|nr:hypothetical protein K1719_012027 [Acacia pycnantha]
MNKTFFSDVNDTKDTWSILAKVLRKWSVKRKVAPYAVWKVGMLLADENGSRIEVSATHKNLIGKLKDEPREGMHGLQLPEFSDVIGFLQAFGRLQDQRRECDIIKRLNFSIADQSENTINVALWGDCDEETFRKKHEDMEPPITVLECDIVTKVTIQKCETLYGWFYDACPCDKKPEYQSNGSLKCTKCDKDVLMTVPKYKVHYKVYDDTGKCSIIFFDHHATELLGKSASKMKEDMQEEGRNSTIPKELNEIGWKLVIVKLKIKSHNIKHRTSSIGVTQFCVDNNLIKQFKYSNQEESTASIGNTHTISQENVIEDGDNTVSQLTTPPEAYTKWKTLDNDSPIVYEDLGLAEICTPRMSSTKPLKNIKKEK